jgi:hypothetical protein
LFDRNSLLSLEVKEAEGDRLVAQEKALKKVLALRIRRSL